MPKHLRVEMVEKMSNSNLFDLAEANWQPREAKFGPLVSRVAYDHAQIKFAYWIASSNPTE